MIRLLSPSSRGSGPSAQSSRKLSYTVAIAMTIACVLLTPAVWSARPVSPETIGVKPEEKRAADKTAGVQTDEKLLTPVAMPLDNTADVSPTQPGQPSPETIKPLIEGSTSTPVKMRHIARRLPRPLYDGVAMPASATITAKSKASSVALDPEVEGLLNEIKSRPWEAQPGESGASAKLSPDNGELKYKRIGLEKIFEEAIQHSLALAQAKARVDEPSGQPGDVRDANMLIWILPQNTNTLKEASRLNIEGAKSHVEAVRQKTLLDSAKLYSDLTKAYLEQYVSGQSIAKALRQLNTEEKRFENGEVNRSDVTRNQMTVIERYNHYLGAYSAYKTLCAGLSSILGAKPEHLDRILWIPEDFSWQNGQPVVSSLHLFPEVITIEGVRRAANLRPDVREADLRLEAMTRLVKISFGQDKDKRKAELRQMEFERDKAVQTLQVALSKAYNDYRYAEKTVELAQRQADLATRSRQQVEVSYKAGFSSAREVQDAETELIKVQTALMGARVAANFSRIQLVYEMGLLRENILSRPIENSL